MTALYLIFGLLIVGFAFEYNKTVGAMLLVVIVLGSWFTAHRKGMI